MTLVGYLLIATAFVCAVIAFLAAWVPSRKAIKAGSRKAINKEK